MRSKKPKAEARGAYESAKKEKVKEKAQKYLKSFFNHKESVISIDNNQEIEQNLVEKIANLILEEEWEELSKKKKKNKIENVIRKAELEKNNLDKIDQKEKMRIIKGLFNSEIWKNEKNLESLKKHIDGPQINGVLKTAQNEDMTTEALKNGIKRVLDLDISETKENETEESLELPEVSFDNTKNIENILTKDFIKDVAAKYLNLAAKEAGYKDIDITKSDAKSYLTEFRGVLETNLEENFEEGKISEEGKKRLFDMAEGKVAYIRRNKEKSSNKNKAA